MKWDIDDAPEPVLILAFVFWSLVLVGLVRLFIEYPGWKRILCILGAIPAVIGSFGSYWELTNRAEDRVKKIYRRWKDRRR